MTDARQLTGRRVLIVDDEPSTLDVLCSTLESEGCTVLVATSGLAAVRAARRSRPDLVVLDICMPDVDGFATCEQLKQHPATATTRVVFLSGVEEPDTLTRGLAVGGADVIPKRLRWSEVIERIKAHLVTAPADPPHHDGH